MFRNDTMHHGEAEAAAVFLRSMEGIKDYLKLVLGYTRTSILHAYDHTFNILHRPVPALPQAHTPMRCGDPQLSAVSLPHSLYCIQDQVQKNLVKLLVVAIDERFGL